MHAPLAREIEAHTTIAMEGRGEEEEKEGMGGWVVGWEGGREREKVQEEIG